MTPARKTEKEGTSPGSRVKRERNDDSNRRARIDIERRKFRRHPGKNQIPQGTRGSYYGNWSVIRRGRSEGNVREGERRSRLEG
ncbi:unnamed protein product, partial [Nesidiocoris tenuis]